MDYRTEALKILPHICARCAREFSGKRLREPGHRLNQVHESNRSAHLRFRQRGRMCSAPGVDDALDWLRFILTCQRFQQRLHGERVARRDDQLATT